MKLVSSLALGALLAISAQWAVADVKTYDSHEWHLFLSSTPLPAVDVANGGHLVNYDNRFNERGERTTISWDQKTQTATEDGKTYLAGPETVTYYFWRLYDSSWVEKSSLPAQYNSYEWTNSWTVSDLPPPPVPEAETWALLSLGLPLVLWRRAYRRTSR